MDRAGEPAPFLGGGNLSSRARRDHDVADRVLHLAEPVCASSGYELVDVRFVMEQGADVEDLDV